MVTLVTFHMHFKYLFALLFYISFLIAITFFYVYLMYGNVGSHFLNGHERSHPAIHQNCLSKHD